MTRDGGTGTMSVDHNVFLYFLVNHEKVNLPRYMFNYMCWAIKETCGAKKTKQVPYARNQVNHLIRILEPAQEESSMEENRCII